MDALAVALDANGYGSAVPETEKIRLLSECVRRLYEDRDHDRQKISELKMQLMALQKSVARLEHTAPPPPLPDIKMPPPHPLKTIAKEVCAKHNISINELKGPRRQKHLVAARREFCFLAARHTSRSYPEIGRFLGDRDHSTIWHSIQKYSEENGIKDWPRESETKKLK